eukprot:TRINITY_DN625_c0_g1_i4.p1 TRINITY_DN625_c0_g1~~TRINITY_DN625_c0_g1_i4.p1  ORF type:complete len:559 (-),score=61.69 TRINITY_DN625_c0_g1_i4:13-1689(-)
MKLYVALLLLRLALVFSSGYIHPDEFFQSPEITSSDIFGLQQTFIPWEFADKQNPCRSIVPPYLNSGIPFLLSKLFLGESNYAGWLLYLPRIWMFLFSLVMDWAAFKLSKSLNLSSSQTLAVVSSSWIFLLFLTRTFSNSLEAILVTLVLVIDPFLVGGDGSKSGVRGWWLGFIISLGIFTRFTFTFFFFPIGIYIILRHYTFVQTSYTKRNKTLSWHQFIASLIKFLLPTLFGFLLASSVLIIIDSLYFGSLYFLIGEEKATIHDWSKVLFSPLRWANIKGKITLTPLNSLLYNLDPKNLELHGLHPRWLHIAVNFPILVGPIALIVFIELGKSLVYLYRLFSYNSRHSLPQTLITKFTLLGVIFSGLAFLSLSPHQEPRFLIPLVLPSLLVSVPHFTGSKYKKILIPVWFLFNLSMTILWGVLHQGGLVPSLLKLQDTLQQQNDPLANQHVTILFHTTYMPPRFILGYPSFYSFPFELELQDLGSPSSEELQQKIKALNDNGVIYLVIPLSEVKKSGDALRGCSKVWGYRPHLITEDFSSFPNDAELQVYKIDNKT